MTKIAFDCTHFVKGRSGGFESYLINLLDGLMELGELNITLYILKSQKDSFSKYSKYFTLKSVSVASLYQRILWQNFVLPVLSFGHKVILFPANFRPLILFCKSVTVIHDLQYIHYPSYWGYLKLLYRKFFIPYSIKYSNQVVCISNTVKSEIQKYFHRNDINVIYNAIKPKTFSSPEWRVINSFVPEKFFLVPSTLHPHKNILNLVMAIDELCLANDSPYYIFIGAYTYTDFPQNYKSDKIIVYGYVDVEFLDSLYANCMGVILPSVYEGFGMPYAEALFAQKAIVASDIAIAREILNDGAVYIQSPFDSVQIKIALKRLMDKSIPIRIHSDISALKAQTNPIFVANKYINILGKCLLQGK